MELQIQDLVSSIKREGIEEAERQKAEILEEAKAQAERIISEAKSEAARIADESRRTLELEKESSISAARQASRDVVISLKKEIGDILSSLLAHKVSQTLGPKEIGAIVVAALKGEDPGKYELQVKSLDAELKAALAEKIAQGLTLASLPGIDGFRLSAKDGSGFYDFSDEEIAGLMKSFIGNLAI